MKATTAGEVVSLYLLTMTKKTWDNKGYMLVLVDLYTKFIAIFAYVDKKSAMQFVQTFVASCANAFNVWVKCLHSDGEFKGHKDLDAMCAQAGIIQEFSTAETSQLKGEAQRLMRTLVEAARTLCKRGNVPAHLREQAMQYWEYVHNLTRERCFRIRFPGRSLLWRTSDVLRR